MSSQRDRWLGAALAVIRAASILVPSAERARWRSEWQAELEHWSWRGYAEPGRGGSPPPTKPGRLRLMRRAALAALDASRFRVESVFAPGNERPPSESRATPGIPWESGSMTRDVLRDARFCFRRWRKHPLHTASVLLTLALGIGANTAVFSVVNAVLLNPLPYESADRLFYVDRLLIEVGATTALPYSDLLEMRRRSQTLQRLEAVDTEAGTLGVGEDAVPVRIGFVTPGLFPALGLSPVLGRDFAEGDAVTVPAPVALLGEERWRTVHAGRPDVLGTAVTLDGETRTVVGVVDDRIRYLRPNVDVWIPLNTATDPAASLGVLAWRHPGVPVEAARAEMETFEFRHERFGPTRPQLARPTELEGARTRTLLYAALLATAVVLLIASVNVAHLMLARAAARRADIAVQTALGASRARIAREALVECALLALAGAALGALVAVQGIDLLRALEPDSLPFALEDVRVDRAVVGYGLAALVLAILFTGLAPVVASLRAQPAAAMRRGNCTTVAHGGGRFLRQGFLAAEVGLSVALLTGAGVLVHSLVRLHTFDPGYDADRLVSVGVQVVEPGGDPAQRGSLYDLLLEAVRTIHGIESVTLASDAPVHAMVFGGAIEVEETGAVHQQVLASLTHTATDYFAVLGIPFLQGRDFETVDSESPESPVILGRSLAERLFPGGSAVGRSFRRPQDPSGTAYRIVGVVADATQLDPVSAASREFHQIYRPLSRMEPRTPETGGPPEPLSLRLLLRAAPGSLVPLEALAVRLRPLGADVDVADGAESLRARLSETLDGPRFNVVLFGGFAAIALALTVVGLYGVISQSVEQRAREVGIRLAIGASAGDVRWLVLRQGLLPVSIGIGAGLLGSAAAVRILTGLVYLVEPFDPPVFMAVPSLVLVVATAAILIPAVRATRLDPAAVSRAE